MVGKVRTSNGREEKTSFCIVDAQSVKNTDTAEEKGYDGGKRVSGIKRHLATDTQGLPHAIEVTTAAVADRDGAILMVEREKENLSDVKNVLTDGSSLGILFAASKFNPLLSDAYRLVIFNIYSFYMPTFLQAIDLKEYLILTKSCKFNNLKKCSHVIVDLGLSISY